jgi:NCAIR mutase (PurE)-related protein
VDADAVTQLLADVRAGRIEIDDAARTLRRLPFTDLGYARVDHHRALRQPWAEAVYGPGKTPAQCAAIVAELHAADPTSPIVLTRANPAQAAAALERTPGGTRHPASAPQAPGPRLVGELTNDTPADGAEASAVDDATIGSAHELTTVVWRPAPTRPETVAVVTAGTADLPVAEECAATLAAHGLDPVRLTDVGVAGVHRLLASVDVILDADAVVVVAGMEGALASVVGGLTGAPVVAVPTSVGYGSSLEGVTALLGMLASCAAGLTVVGIDNGFGAACAILRILYGGAASAIELDDVETTSVVSMRVSSTPDAEDDADGTATQAANG